MARRSANRGRPRLPATLRGVLAAVLTVAALQLLGRTPLQLEAPSPVLLLAVTVASLIGGVRAGLFGAAIAVAYHAYVHSAPTGLFVFAPEDLRRVIVLAVVAPTVAWTVGRLRARLDGFIARERAAAGAAEAATRRAGLLAEASKILSSSLDYETTIANVARLAVTTLADWCIVYVIEEDGRVRRLEAAHADPAAEPLARRIREFPIDRGRSHPLGPILQEGRSILMTDAPFEIFRAFATDETQLAALRELGVLSAIFSPIVSRGRTLGAIAFLSTSPARRFNEDDRALADELARRAGQAVDNARLYGAALEANRVRSDFLAVISHELRTPLNAIIGFTDLLQAKISGPLNPKQGEQLERIEASARHLLDLIEQILAFSRAEAGREPVQLGTVDVFGLARETMELIRPRAEEKGLTLVDRIPARTWLIATDAAKIRQILLSLLANAVKFTETGAVTVEAEGHEQSAVLRVIDTGIGIPAEHHERIFEPFRQVESPTTRRAGGTGLGLSIARRLARLLGGDITVASRTGEGSTFTVRLPAGRRPPDI